MNSRDLNGVGILLYLYWFCPIKKVLVNLPSMKWSNKKINTIYWIW